MKNFLLLFLIFVLVIVTIVVFDSVFLKTTKTEPVHSVEEEIPICTVAFLHFEMYVPENNIEQCPADEEKEPKFLGEFVLTAYCSCSKCCGIWGENRPLDEEGKEVVVGSTGKRLYAGRSIAVDPSVIPYGTEVIIDGKVYVAEDCGGAIKGNRIDVYFDDHESALEFGRQTKNIYCEG